MTEITARLKTALADHYAIEREIGAGGMATVYLAEDLKHHRPVAVKVLRPDLAAALGPERFLREIEIAANLTHPHIVPLYDSGEADGFLYYVLPYIEGESLRAKLEREGELPIADAVRILRDVVDALTDAHEHGVVHRDIKPDNVLLTKHHALVTDFGVAKAVSEATGRQALTTAGVALGTPAYMAPEQATADPRVDHRADIYAVGALGYELLTGSPPFTGDSPQMILASHVTQSPEPVTKRRPTVPPGLAQLLMRCLEKKPADRWQSADELLAALEPLSTPSGGTAPVAGIEPALSKRRLAGVAGTAAAALLIGSAWFLLQRSPSTAEPIVPNRVAIFPFAVRSASDDLDYLREGVVELLSTAIDGAADLRTVDPSAVLQVATSRGEDALGPERAAEIARQFGAGRYILGSVTDAGGGRIQIRGSLYRLADDAPLVAQAIGEASRALELVRELARQLLVGYTTAAGGRVDSLALLTTDSVEALKAYVAGVQEYRAGRYQSAVDELQRAVLIDTAFALAYYKLSRAASWAELHDVGEEAADRAMALSGRLSDRHRLLLQAAVAFESGSPDQAEEATLTIVRSYPNDSEAWYLLGETRFHYNWFRAQPPGEAREPFERAFSLDPGRGDAFDHLYDLALLERDVEAIDSLVRQRYPDVIDPIHARAAHALASGDSAAMNEVISELPADEFTRAYWSFRFGWMWGDLRAGQDAIRLLTEPTRSTAWQSRGHVLTAYFAITGGQRDAMGQELAVAARLDRAGALEARALLAAIGFPPVPQSEVRSLRDSLLEWDATAVPACSDPTLMLCVHDQAHPHLRAYLLGLLSARLGDNAAALRYAGELGRLGGPPQVQSLAHDLVRGIRALVAQGRGDAEGALRELEQTATERDVRLLRDSEFYSLTFERYLKAELVTVLGRYDEALRRYESLGWVFMLPIAHLRRGEIYEQLGDVQKAIVQYDRFLELWSDADAEYQPLVEDVRGRVARLVAEPGRDSR